MPTRNRTCQSCGMSRIEAGLEHTCQDEWLKDKWSVIFIIVTSIGLWVAWNIFSS